jgi:hypothetical protein
VKTRPFTAEFNDARHFSFSNFICFHNVVLSHTRAIMLLLQVLYLNLFPLFDYIIITFNEMCKD